jgi:glucose/arabinose dehydrogenase
MVHISRVLAAAFLLAQENEPPEVRGGGKGVRMDYGPFLSSTVSRVKYRKDDDLLAYKCLSIKVGKDATCCFDPDLLRMAGAWTGGFLDLSNTHLVSYKGSLPTTLQGMLLFSTPKVPGWTPAGDFADPRPHPYGPLPADRGRYDGLYVHGDKVVLSYTVAGCPVLELPEFAEGAFTRTFTLGPSKTPLALLAGDAKAEVDGAPFPVEDGRVRLPALEKRVTFRLSLGGRPKAPLVDPAELTRGGPGRWTPALETKGMVGLGEGPYVVDTLALPEKNPWESWIRLTALDFFPDGRCAVSTWNGDVWIVSGIDEKLERLSWRRFAAGLYEPLGLKVVDDKVYVLARDQITRLHDLDGDGEADFYENFNNVGTTMANYHAFAFELHTDPEGNFYWAADGHRVESDVPLHGCILRISRDGKRHEVLATGFRAPNGMSVGPRGEVTASDNQGNWMPASKVNLVRKGGYYGYEPHSGAKAPPRDFDKPICWIPQALDNSSGGQVWVTSDRWGPFQGHLLHTSYGTAWLFHVPHEFVGDQVQGGVVKFPLAFASGIMRGRFNPKDGQLYVCGLRGWQTTGVRDGCLQRVRYTGKPVHMLLAVHVRREALELTFTSPLDRERATDPDAWGALQWNYVWSEKYGSPDWSVADPKKQGRDPVEIKAIRLSEDGRTVTLEIPGLRPVMQMQVRARLRAADGTPVPLELVHTINRVP